MKIRNIKVEFDFLDADDMEKFEDGSCYKFGADNTKSIDEAP